MLEVKDKWHLPSPRESDAFCGNPKCWRKSGINTDVSSCVYLPNMYTLFFKYVLFLLLFPVPGIVLGTTANKNNKIPALVVITFNWEEKQKKLTSICQLVKVLYRQTKVRATKMMRALLHLGQKGLFDKVILTFDLWTKTQSKWNQPNCSAHFQWACQKCWELGMKRSENTCYRKLDSFGFILGLVFWSYYYWYEIHIT